MQLPPPPPDKIASLGLFFLFGEDAIKELQVAGATGTETGSTNLLAGKYG